MLRRDLLQSWMATPLGGWLRRWVLLRSDGEATEGPNAADVYRRAFGWAEGLRPEESGLLREATTIAIDDPHVGALIQQARPALQAIREASALDQCRWETETVTSDDLGKGHLDVSNLNVIRVACLSARRHAKSGQTRDALDDVFACLTLAHRIGTGGCLFARILECGGEVPAFQTLGRILPGLDSGSRRPFEASRRPAPSGTGLGRDRTRVAVHPGLAPHPAHDDRAGGRWRRMGRARIR